MSGPIARRRRAPAVAAWTESDGRGFVVARESEGGAPVYFVAHPPSWSTSWRDATQFESRYEAALQIAPKTISTPPGPAAERGAVVLQLGPEIGRAK